MKRPDARKFNPPNAVLEIAKDLETAGFEAWAVGGAVRDALLGEQHLDWDLATNATPDQVRTVFGRKRTIPVGVEFGTVGVLDRDGELHEVTTFRRDVQTDGRHAVVEFGASLDEDLARRDFTINAIAYSPTTKQLVDPFKGRADLEAGIVRAVGVAADRMREDRLRALRAIRFAARFGFEMDRDTWKSLQESATHLTRLSAERVKQELEKTMDQVDAPSTALRMWRESGALAVLIPELQSVDDLVFRAVDCAARPGLPRRPGRRLTRIATLFSDCSADAAFRAATRLRFSNADARWISAMAGNWGRLGPHMTRALSDAGPSPADIRRWIAAITRPMLSGFFRVGAARWAALRERDGEPAAQHVHSVYRRAIRAALTEPVDLRDLAVDGDDLRQAGIPAGPGLGKILSLLLERVLEDPSFNTRDQLLAEARRLSSAQD